jgi:putative NADH-flavin reductase
MNLHKQKNKRIIRNKEKNYNYNNILLFNNDIYEKNTMFKTVDGVVSSASASNAKQNTNRFKTFKKEETTFVDSFF